MKRGFLKVILTSAAIVVFMAFAVASGESTPTDQGKAQVEETSGGNNLGNYNVEIKSCRLAKDYEGKDIVIVNYGFTNNADESKAFSYALETAVFQNGIGLNEAYVLSDSAQYSADNQTKEIKKGSTLDVEVAYELNDTITDIDVEVKEFISWNDSVIKKTFSITQ